ncbi:hypothetical protein Sta7437_0097 [Stanieria cyanosphaera PCC 7437]|uniref:Uncharacterized protein n=1 Tax=Stanieria cyanosphaera (strain ATCC 29371 / PCC 7437) TaxID=111780 RepID=K9XPW0_STAC7|nr:hypothetical protein [Stanieria cyanosphaera]AFZ33717.1 hypothetical protein Sta7437_0097 [Stanieria cyanosphaera PCC 7437]
MNYQFLNIPNPQSKQEAVISEPSNINRNTGENLAVPPAALIVIPGGLLVLAAILGFYRKINLTKIKDRSLFETDEQTTCKNCRFFSHNPYLKCALHPSRVSTTESIECADYWSNKSDRFQQKSK